MKQGQERAHNCFIQCYSGVFIISFYFWSLRRSLFFHAFIINGTKEYVTESTFNIKLWRSLWLSMLLASDSESMFLVTFQEITISGSEGACDGVCF